MKQARFLLPMIAVSLAAAGCRPAQRNANPAAFDPQSLSGSRALVEAERFIACGARVSGTQGARRAADYIREQLRTMDIAAEIDKFTDKTPDGTLTFRNVTGVIPGSGAGWVVIASHYDTKSGISPEFKGANDSGSSTGLLLELGRALKGQTKPPVNILLAFLDGEECRRGYGASDGLHGSRRMAQVMLSDGRAADTYAVIVIDMIGDRDLTLTLPRNVTPELGSAMLKAAEREGVRRLCRLLPYPILDDHQPFLDAGMPSVVLIDFEFGSAPGLNDYWHTPADTFDKLSAESLQTTGRMVIHMLNGIMP